MQTLRNLFKFNQEYSQKTILLQSTTGLIIILSTWALLSGTVISQSLLPSPLDVLYAFKDLYYKDNLLANILYSIKLNMFGYLIAVAVALPLGFAMGLFSVIRGLFKKYVDAIRFVPLTAAVGLFIAWFGIQDTMKVSFLAFGIFVYLLPVVIQRVDDTEKVYIDTVYTLGATPWQTVKTVYIPSVFSKVSDDTRVLVAISWTYLIVAEVVNKTGGLGAIANTAARQSNVAKVYAILVLIILIGILQDKLFIWIDKMLFPYKHTKTN